MAESESGSLYNLYDLAVARRVAAQSHHYLGNSDHAIQEGEECIRLVTQLQEAGFPKADGELMGELNNELEVYLQSHESEID